MTFLGWLTIFLFVTLLTVLAMPLGRYMAAVYSGERTFLDPLFRTPGAAVLPDHAGQPGRRPAPRTGRHTPRA